MMDSLYYGFPVLWSFLHSSDADDADNKEGFYRQDKVRIIKPVIALMKKYEGKIEGIVPPHKVAEAPDAQV